MIRLRHGYGGQAHACQGYGGRVRMPICPGRLLLYPTITRGRTRHLAC